MIISSDNKIVEVSEQVYTFCRGCNTQFLVEIRYPTGHRPVLVDRGWCPQCRDEVRKDESTKVHADG